MTPTVLIVDDDQVFVALINQVMRKFGIGCEGFLRAQDLLARLDGVRPSLCLVDLNIGSKGDGYDLVAAIRAKVGPDLPVFIISGTEDRSAIAHALEIGANDYILKPVDREVLSSKLMRYIKTQELEMAKLGTPTSMQTRIPSTLKSPVKILEVDESGVTISTDHLITKGSAVHLRGEVVSQITGREAVLLNAVMATLDPECDRFEVILEFDPLDEGLAAAVRQWISSKAS